MIAFIETREKTRLIDLKRERERERDKGKFLSTGSIKDKALVS